MRYLADALSLPSVSFGVIPARVRRRIWPLEGFLIFDDTAVQAELLSARVTVTRPGEIDLYVRYVGPSSGGGIWDESSSAGIGVTEGDPGAVIVSRPRPGWVRLPPSILPAPTVLSSAKK